MILHCQQCKSKIAEFDELKHPITPDQFRPYRKDRPIPPYFGGEKKTADTFICPYCKRWPFECPDNYEKDSFGKTAKKEPGMVLIAYESGREWYKIPDLKVFDECACGYKTEYPKLMSRHKKGCKEWKAQQNK